MKTWTHFILAGAVLLLCINCSGDDLNNEPEIIIDPPARIIYTDIEPDFSSAQNPSFDLDLNNDQIVDYVLQYDEEWLALVIASNPSDQNSIISVAPWYAHPVPLQFDKEISTNADLAFPNQGLYYSTWSIFSVGDCPVGESNCFYDWKDQGDRFLGLQFGVNGKVYYGWARIAVTSPTEWVVKDYAYRETPDKPLFAGRY